MHPLTDASPQRKSTASTSSASADSGSKLAHRAFWIMTRRVTLVAAGVDTAFFVLFLAFHSPFLAWLNVLSLAMYGLAYWMIGRHKNVGAIVIIWLEVLGHSAIGSLLVGWDSGFHYFLLMFIPAIVINRKNKLAALLLLLLLMFYLGLHAVSRAFGPIDPLSITGTMVVHSFNVAVVFAMAGYTARFYYGVVRRAERKLRQMATTDALSGLFNRHHLLARAEREIMAARRTHDPITLIIADIDHFKRVNDRHGHIAGDRVIAHAGKLLLEACRAKDIVCRWGGEEFLLMLPATTVAAASSLAERIREHVEAATIDHDGVGIRYTLSLGIARYSDGEDLNNAIARADIALYQSKERGRNCITVAN